MTKPDFKQMTRKELKKYILTHPTDDEAIRELFINRRNPNVKVYPYPLYKTYPKLPITLQIWTLAFNSCFTQGCACPNVIRGDAARTLW